jgi:hypothetical protein
VPVVAVGGQPQDVGQADQREQLAAQPVHRGAADLLDRGRRLPGVQRDELLEADLRDRVAVAGALDGQRGDDRERQRDAQPADGARPGTDSTSMVPPIDSMLVLTTSMPTPRPETLVTAEAVEKPGRKTAAGRPAGSSGGGRAAVITPRSTPWRPPGPVDPGAVVGDLHHDLTALVAGPAA